MLGLRKFPNRPRLNPPRLGNDQTGRWSSTLGWFRVLFGEKGRGQEERWHVQNKDRDPVLPAQA
jgi:hypothetical protein